ncbi:hypothetical protein ACIRG5_10410 [Lentzea sp. NPDC102401]|uniref:hypothetical protein n=1 Tax=Lentzea sp. NPDC102401 TaxID=3364128 RepID=UPI00380F4C78
MTTGAKTSKSQRKITCPRPTATGPPLPLAIPAPTKPTGELPHVADQQLLRARSPNRWIQEITDSRACKPVAISASQKKQFIRFVPSKYENPADAVAVG